MVHIYIYVCMYIYIYIYIYTGLFEMIVGVLTTCHTQYCTLELGVYVFFLFNRTTLQVFVPYLTYPGTEGTNQNRH